MAGYFLQHEICRLCEATSHGHTMPMHTMQGQEYRKKGQVTCLGFSYHCSQVSSYANFEQKKDKWACNFQLMSCFPLCICTFVFILLFNSAYGIYDFLQKSSPLQLSAKGFNIAQSMDGGHLSMRKALFIVMVPSSEAYVLGGLFSISPQYPHMVTPDKHLGAPWSIFLK